MKKNGFSLVAAIITLALAGGAASATGCGGVSTSSLCQDICACQRCTSNDLAACEDSGTKASDAADAAGCTSQFDDAVTCAGAHVSCKNNQAVTDGCDAELAALTKCSSTLSVVGKTACELAFDQIAAKQNGCPDHPNNPNPSTGSGSTVACTDALGTLDLCQAACFAGATCECLGLDNSKMCAQADGTSFINCISKCK